MPQAAPTPSLAAAADLADGRRPTAGTPPGLQRLGRGVVAATLVLIMLGAMVTSTGSGMAFEDWPLANGSLWPGSMNLPQFLEHGHRVFASLIGLATVSLAVWTWRVDSRRWLRRLVAVAVGLVIVQGIVGGLGVLKNLPVYTSVTHGVLPQVFVGVLGWIALASSPGWQERQPAPAATVATARRLCVVALALIPVQTFLGASLRHTNQLAYLWLHAGFAFVVALAALIAAFYCAERLPAALRLRPAANAVLAVLGLQLVLGFVALAARQPKDPSNVEQLGRAVLVSVHVVVGAALFLSVALLTLRVWRGALPEANVGRGAEGSAG